MQPYIRKNPKMWRVAPNPRAERVLADQGTQARTFRAIRKRKYPPGNKIKPPR